MDEAEHLADHDKSGLLEQAEHRVLLAQKMTGILRAAGQQDWVGASGLIDAIHDEYEAPGLFLMCRILAELSIELMGGHPPTADGTPGFMFFTLLDEDDTPLDPDQAPPGFGRMLAAASRLLCAHFNKDQQQCEALFLAAYNDPGDGIVDLVTGMILITLDSTSKATPEVLARFNAGLNQ